MIVMNKEAAAAISGWRTVRISPASAVTWDNRISQSLLPGCDSVDHLDQDIWRIG